MALGYSIGKLLDLPDCIGLPTPLGFLLIINKLTPLVKYLDIQDS